MIQDLYRSLNKVLLGKERAVRLLLDALLAGGHVLIEDVPGTGKTSLAKSLAVGLGADFSRVQFTPDLLPGDITGGAIYKANTGDFELRKGPVFTEILLADEINRASPRTQSALLEAMEEKQVSLEGSAHALSPLFMVIATQNPVEFHGVYPLPEAQMDRFLIRFSIGYPSEQTELDILRFKASMLSDSILVPKMVLQMQEEVLKVHVDEALELYIVNLVMATRSHKALRLAASPRAGVSILKMAKANAYLDQRNYVTPEDIQYVLVPSLAHRIFAVESGLGLSEAIVEEIRKSVKIPV